MTDITLFRAAQSGDKAARDKLIENNLGFVRHVINEISPENRINLYDVVKK